MVSMAILTEATTGKAGERSTKHTNILHILTQLEHEACGVSTNPVLAILTTKSNLDKIVFSQTTSFLKIVYYILFVLHKKG